ncbi:uncharacterized protein K489DRAFT_411813 [Dissoconium aciculare CBS 342.82]|uniref:Uncharacterized protein n=1 Tax=Dissoconium aciculare CBS 342.82 TaxID=1314786 RepID=A0A6J3LXT6_9PEZI|nr:uncharacterized protein K489DRAFT_411813 [Dissoconium aciculare CBS 342.82]KAF1820570.1 hypothetical protein K489DRAFT_411813 [Dissoconium aciculare CBS 342.82]
MAPMALSQFLQRRVPPNSHPRYSAGHPGMTEKEWATRQQKFAIRSWTVCTSLNQFFEEPLAAADVNRLTKQVDYEDHQQWCISEGMVEISFAENIVAPLKNAFHDSPFVHFANKHPHSGPPPEGARNNGVIDWLFRTIGSDATNPTRWLCIGDMKGPRIINNRQWAGGDFNTLTGPTVHLMQELKGYAFHYRVPRVFCYDADHLVLIRWKSLDLNEAPNVVVIAVGGSNGMQVREAMYRMVCDGLNHEIRGPRICD